MAVPKYDEMYNDFLITLVDGKEHDIKEIREIVAKKKKLTDEEKDIIRPHLECNYKIVMLYPINENTEIPTDALDPEIWNIPEGYYAIEIE